MKPFVYHARLSVNDLSSIDRSVKMAYVSGSSMVDYQESERWCNSHMNRKVLRFANTQARIAIMKISTTK